MREGGENCLKYLKMGWNRKEGSGNKDFKKGAQAGSRGGCLKKGGTGTPLRTMIQFLQSSERSIQSIKKTQIKGVRIRK